MLSSYGYRISKKGDLLVIKRASGEKLEVSVGNIGQIVAFARGLSLSGDAINLMLRHGVNLILVSRNRPLGILQAFRRGTHVKLKKEQVYAQMDNRAVAIAKSIVYGKISNQIELLRQIRRNRLRRKPDISSRVLNIYNNIKDILREVERIDLDIDNYREKLLVREAEASRLYWEAISTILPEEIGFKCRKKRFENPDDPFNLSLNYLYTLLASQIWSCIELSGLDPWLGYFHVDNNRRPSLVMDLMEEFRQPVVDKILISYFLSYKGDFNDIVMNCRVLSETHIREISRLFFQKINERVSFRGRVMSISGHMYFQPRRLAKFILGKEPGYIPYNVV